MSRLGREKCGYLGVHSQVGIPGYRPTFKVQELNKQDSMASTPRMTLNLESLLLLFLFSKVVTEIPICAVMIEGMFLNYLANTSSDGLIVESSV